LSAYFFKDAFEDQFQSRKYEKKNTKLKKSCVVLVPGPAVAKVKVPAVFECFTLSSFRLFCHFCVIVGSPFRPEQRLWN
jgi:hypothetical protein